MIAVITCVYRPRCCDICDNVSSLRVHFYNLAILVIHVTNIVKSVVFRCYSDVQLKIVLGMVTSTTAVVVQDVERNSGRVCVEFVGPNRQQQASDKYVDDPCGREHRARRGYR